MSHIKFNRSLSIMLLIGMIILMSCQGRGAMTNTADDIHELEESQESVSGLTKEVGDLEVKEKIFHYAEAAKMGDAKAFESLLWVLLFEGGLIDVKPEFVLEVYGLGKAKNPALGASGEVDELSIIRKCIEVGPFDFRAFVKKYGIDEDELDRAYFIWELAEEASRGGGRFGKPNNTLALQLIIRGCRSAPVELEVAVDSIYRDWKANKKSIFNICDYAISSHGAGYCADKEVKQAEAKNSKLVKALSLSLKNHAGVLLTDTYKIASDFFDIKAQPKRNGILDRTIRLQYYYLLWSIKRLIWH